MVKRRVVTDRTIRDVAAKGGTQLELPADAIVTPLARETAAEHRIALVPLQSPGTGPSSPAAAAPTGHADGAAVIALGADHGGYALKGEIKALLHGLGYAVEDVGTNSDTPCDYPDFAFAVGRLVASGAATLGIMIDGAGIGSCIVANKLPGVRGACCTNEVMAGSAREHNDANVLTLGSKIIGSEVAKAIVRTFLSTSFGGGRHEARVSKIRDVDAKYRKG